MRLDLHSGAERSGRAASAALPFPAQPRVNEAVAHGSRAPLCDFCRRSLIRGERHRLVWRRQSATELILADLCRRCATDAASLVDRYGGHGRAAIALVDDAWLPTPQHRLFAPLARAAIYLLIALTFFLIVTLLSSLTR